MASRTSVTFSSLPTDLHNLIVSYVIRPKDLASLCRVNQHFRDVAVRHLYREVILDIGGPGDSRLSALLSPRNPGLKHIRVLDLYNAPDDNCGQKQQAAFTVKLILDFLPRDILEKFRWHPWDVFSSDNLILLYQTQRNLERLEAVSLDKPLTEELKKKLDFDSAVTDNVKTLGLYPDSRDALEFSQELLKRKQKLVKLTIGSNFVDDDDEDEDMEDDVDSLSDLNDLATRPGRITSTLFRHMSPFTKCTAIQLEDLTLEKLYLRYSSLTYCKVIDMPHLKKLKVIECKASGALFAALCRSNLLPLNLDTLEVTHSDDGAEKELIKALDEFLPLLTCLKELCVEIGGTSALPNYKSIVRHGKTLRILSLHCSTSRTDHTLQGDEIAEIVYPVRNFESICKACTQLRQLSVALPRTPITATPAHGYTTFLATIQRYLRQLVTLQISTWPTNNLSRSSTNTLLTSPPAICLPGKLYSHMLQLIAQDLFDYESDIDQTTEEQFLVELLGNMNGTATADEAGSSSDQPAPARVHTNKTQSHLRLIAFGTADRDYDRTEKTQMVLFAKGKAIHPSTGKESVMAMRIGWNERRWWEPESEILDWALQRGGQMPVLGSGDSFADDIDF